MIFLNCLLETLNYAEIMFRDVFDKYKPFYYRRNVHVIQSLIWCFSKGSTYEFWPYLPKWVFSEGVTHFLLLFYASLRLKHGMK